MGVAQKAIKGQLTPLANEVVALTERITALEAQPSMTETDWAIFAKAAALVTEFEAMADAPITVAETSAGESVTVPEIK